MDLPLDGAGGKKAAPRRDSGHPHGPVTTLSDSWSSYYANLPAPVRPTKAERQQGRLLFFVLLLLLTGVSYALYYTLRHV